MNATPTIADLARALNLSISSVSYALNGHKGVSEATRRRVIEYASRVGYRANSSARALSSARTSSIGIVIRDDYAVIRTEPYYLRFLAGVAATLEGTEVELIVKLTEAGLGDELAIYRRWAAESRVDGVILIDETVDDPRTDLVQSLGLPAVLHGTSPPRNTELPGILIDDALDSATLVEHLAQQGARRVLHVAGPMRHRHEIRRLQTVAAECSARSLDYGSLTGSYALSHGQHAADVLAAQTATERPDAIIAANDLVAVAACRRLTELGIAVPDDCRVVAWDNSVLCEIAEPPISALDRHPERCGSRAAQMLLECLHGADAAAPEVAEPSELIVRRSSVPTGDA